MMDTPYARDQRTIMFIAQGGAPQRPAYPQRPYAGTPMPRGPCYGCQGDHLYRDYPHKKNILRVTTHCLYCGIKHFIPYCPNHLDKKGKASLNMVRAFPSPIGSKNEKTISVKVVMRAQANRATEDQNVDKTDSEKTDKSSVGIQVKRTHGKLDELK